MDVDATEVFGGRETNNKPLEFKGMKIAKLLRDWGMKSRILGCTFIP